MGNAAPGMHAMTIDEEVWLFRCLCASKKVQRFWRKNKDKTLLRFIQTVAGQGITSEQMRVRTFEDVVEILGRADVIAAFKHLLLRLHQCSVSINNIQSAPDDIPQINVRIVLAAFMMAFFPTKVFESAGGAVERDVTQAAKDIINVIEDISTRVQLHPLRSFQAVTPHAAGMFIDRLFHFLRVFQAWKIPDERRIAARIKHALNALYTSRLQLQPMDLENGNIPQAVTDMIVRLEDKLRRLTNDATAAEFIAAYSAGTIPVVAPDGGAALPGPQQRLPLIDPLLNTRINNEQLAHELMIDNLFQLTERGDVAVNPVADFISSGFHASFWASLGDDMTILPPSFVRVLRVLAEIRDGMVALAGTTEAVHIQEHMDMELIQQQVDQGVWTWASWVPFVTGVVSLIRRVQVPFRDISLEQGWAPIDNEMQANPSPAAQVTLVCKGLRFCLDRVNLSRIDAANARLRLIAPVIRDHGTDYERGKFLERLNAGTITVDKTREWLRCAVVHVAQANAEVVPAIVEGQAWALGAVFAEAMTTLVSTDFPAANWPETLGFDLRRMTSIRSEINHIARCSSALVTVREVIAASNAIPAADLTEAMTRTANALLALELPTCNSDSAEKIQTAVGIAMSEFVPCSSVVVLADLLKDLGFRMQNPVDPVTLLLRRRVISIFQSAANAVDLANVTAQGVEPLLPRIREVARRFSRVVDVSRAIHGERYTAIMREVAGAYDGN